MTIVDLLINELQVDDLDEVQLMELASRLIDVAIEKLKEDKNGKEE